MDINDYISLLSKKNLILNEIFDYTKSKSFKVSEDEIERIEYYLDNREKMYSNLYNIEKEIKSLRKNYFNNINNKEVNSIIEKNDLLIKDIIKLDEEKKEVMESIFNLLKKEIKSVKSISKVNNRYLGTYQNVITSNLFDSSR